MYGGDSSSSSSAASAATSLAPGFRFHPTDEELVSYYLKRKIIGKPFKVDAISEIDLYKSDPWDLPSKSRIQSRDMEWYFFSALDKKYANRSRTNRATGQGYWKTTGKDRPVRRNSRNVGMKKTLVYHVGRAPRGERTNWVMHEYRLDDEHMVRAGIPQDAYVVCRIFQKSGSGPQNGAQYGAPLIEEEWEEDDNELVLKEEGGEDPQLDISGQAILQMADFEEIQDMGTQNENAALFLGTDDGLDGFNYLLDLEELWQDQDVVNGVDENINMPVLHGQNLTMDENGGVSDPHHSLAVLKDDYVELNDLVNPVEELQNDRKSVNEVGEGSNLSQLDVEEFFNTMDGNVIASEQSQMYPASENKCYLELNDFVNHVPGDYPSGVLSDDGMMYFDAPSNNPPSEQGYLEINDFLNPITADSSGPDMVDELFAYFDATENSLQYTTMNSYFENSNSADSSILNQSSPEGGGGSIQAHDTSPQASEAILDKGASSSMEVSETGDRSLVPDVESDNGGDWSFTKRLVSMLGSIPSPPAFAAEYPMKGSKSFELDPETHSSRSIHITAGMIQINGVARTGSEKHWSLRNNGDVGFLVSYGMTRNDFVGNSKMHGGTMSLVLQSSCCRFFISLLFLAVSFKMGIYIYGK